MMDPERRARDVPDYFVGVVRPPHSPAPSRPPHDGLRARRATHHPRTDWRPRLLALLIAVVLLGVPGTAGVHGSLAEVLGTAGSQHWPTPRAAPRATPFAADWPVPPDGGPHQFLAVRADGTGPVAYDPCRPLPYVVNGRTAPPVGDALLADAIQQMRRVTGLELVAEGQTDEAPSPDRAAFQPERYGDRWAPLLIAWSDPLESPSLEGRVAGVGGSTSVRADGEPEVYVTGQMVLDGPQLATRLSQHGSTHVRAVLLHELGHVLGLDHVADPSQLMHARTGQTALQPGDLAGLAQLGAGPCVPRL